MLGWRIRGGIPDQSGRAVRHRAINPRGGASAPDHGLLNTAAQPMELGGRPAINRNTSSHANAALRCADVAFDFALKFHCGRPIRLSRLLNRGSVCSVSNIGLSLM